VKIRDNPYSKTGGMGEAGRAGKPNSSEVS